MDKTGIVDLLRHGKPEGGSKYRGHGLDDPLSDKGWQQMWDSVGDYQEWTHVVTSPMKRCAEFARQIATKNNLPLEVVADLKEVGFGSWEGKTKTELRQADAQAFENFYLDPVKNRPKGSEPIEQFYQRVTQAYTKLVAARPEAHYLIVAHAGVIRAIVTHVLQADLATMYRLDIRNAGMSRIKHVFYGARLEWHNVYLSEMKK